MQTIYFSDYKKHSDTAYCLYRLFTELSGKRDIRVVFDKDSYDIFSDYSFERSLAVSNHGWNGPKRIAVLVENMENVELDCGGATLSLHDVMTGFVIKNCHNVTIKNLTLRNEETMFLQARVVSLGDGYVDLMPEFKDSRFFVRRGELVVGYRECILPLRRYIEFNGESGEIEPVTGDDTMGIAFTDARVEALENGAFRLFGVTRYPPIGNHIVINGARRLGSGFFLLDSDKATLEDVTIHSTFGMGLIAVSCADIRLSRFSTQREGDRLFTSNADATHFVNCTGDIIVEDCLFEGQLDDALNIHSMYTRIVDVGENEIFVRQMHGQSTGIRIFKPGDRIAVLKPDTLLPYAERDVLSVEYINDEIARLTLSFSTEEIENNDNIEIISNVANLTFKHNIVRNNRARGMLIAARGKVLIEDNYFHTSGTAIMFEANGDFWFESGGTTDVTIRNNRFVGCKGADWGNAVIECWPRRKVEKNRFFHKSIKVYSNDFSLCPAPPAIFDNVEYAEFEGNSIEAVDGYSKEIIARNVGTLKA